MKRVLALLVVFVFIISGCSLVRVKGGFPFETSKNTLFRGTSLGTTLTEKQAKSIKDGSFEDMWLGDYWTVNGIVYRIWGFDWYLGKGSCTEHHLVVLPDSNLIHADGNSITYMNNSSTTSGGYANTQLRKDLLPYCLEIVINAFGDDHILMHSELLSNAVQAGSGEPGGWDWYDTKIEIPSETMIYGLPAWSSSGFNAGTAHPILPLAQVKPEFVINGENYWLRDVVSSTSFSNAEYNGAALYNDASATWIGVRPFFLLA